MKNQTFKALLFDCDGTLADTISAHEMAYTEVFRQNNLVFDRISYYNMFSSGSLSMLKHITKGKYDTKYLLDLIRQKNLLITRYLDEYMVPNYMLVELIKNTYYGSFKLGVVSNSSRISVKHILDRIGCLNYFDVILSKEDTKNLKPHPDLYIAASQCLNVKGRECLVFEDSLIGIEAARNANMKTVKINIRKCNQKYTNMRY